MSFLIIKEKFCYSIAQDKMQVISSSTLLIKEIHSAVRVWKANKGTQSEDIGSKLLYQADTKFPKPVFLLHPFP